MCYRSVGGEIYVRFDYTAKTLKVFTNAPPIPGFLPGPMRQIAQYKTIEQWLNSQYSLRVQNQRVLGIIQLFFEEISYEEPANTGP